MRWEQIWMLLQVIKELNGHPKYAKLMADAHAELDRLNSLKEEPQVEYQPEPEPTEERRV